MPYPMRAEPGAEPSIEERIASCYGEILRGGLVERLNAAAAARQRRAAAAAFLQAGLRHHQLLLLGEIMTPVGVEGAPGDPACAFFGHTDPAAACRREAAAAERHYRIALALAPDLAEAKYNLALLCRRDGALDEALLLFAGAASTPPHPRAKPHAHLAANAFWQSAAIHHLRGDHGAVARAYERALTLLGNFGVDHLSVALFLRERGRLEEAAEHFERIMPYSHLYAAEFVEPDYEEHEKLPAGADGQPCDPLLATKVDEIPMAGAIFYWWHLYFLVPKDEPRPDLGAVVLTWAAGGAGPRLAGLWRRPRRALPLAAAASIAGLRRMQRREA